MDEQLYISYMKQGLVWDTVRRWALPGAVLVSFIVFVSYDEAPWHADCECSWVYWVAVAGGILVSTALGLAVAVAFEWISIPGRAKAYFAGMPDFQDDVLISFDGGGGSISYTSSVHQFEWSKLTAWFEHPDFLVICRSKFQTAVLPKSQLPEETIDFIREQLISSGLPKPGEFRT